MRRTSFSIFLVILVTICGMSLLAQDLQEPYDIKLDPVADINPVKTQHTIVATVVDRDGNPLPDQRVEWILSRGPKCVGDIVEHDDMRTIVGSRKVEKISNHYTISYTNERETVLDKGTPTVEDDIPVGIGQSWLTITSPVEGETHIIAFCPAIKDSNKHKTFAIKYWIDAKIQWPENAVNKIGTPHTFAFKIVKASTGAPITGNLVNWSLIEEAGAPEAYLGDQQGNASFNTQTNAEGEASVVLNQAQPAEGRNRVKIELRKPDGSLLAVRTVTKTWIAPKIQVQKTGPQEGIIGEELVFDINISNPGDADAQDVVLTDVVPEGLSFISADPQPDGNLTWNIGTLPQNANRSFKITLVPKQVGTWTNTARLTSRTTPPQTSTTTVKIGAPDVYVLKSGKPMVRQGESATYTLTIKNRGNAVARNVIIRDRIPEGMEYKGYSGKTLRWKLGNLTAGESKTISYTLNTPKTGVFVNTAFAFVKNKPVHKVDFRTTVIAPNLTLTKEGSRLSFLHRSFDYTIIATNSGDAVAKDMMLTDTIPPHLDYVSSTPRGSYRPPQGENSATVVWKLGDIEPAQNVEVKVKVRAKKVGVCRNIVTLVSQSPALPTIPQLEAVAETKIMGVPAMHISTYDTEDPCEVGKQTIYVIETRNEGTSPCTNVRMVNTIPEEMEFVSADPRPLSVENGKVTFEAVPILQPGEKLTYKVICKAVRTGSAKNTAKLAYDQFEKEILDEEGTSVYQ